MRLWLLPFALVGLVALHCGDSTKNPSPSNWGDVESLGRGQAENWCRCAVAERGGSLEVCTEARFRLYGPNACTHALYESDAEVARYVDCVLPHALEQQRCYRAAKCDVSAEEACDEDLGRPDCPLPVEVGEALEACVPETFDCVGGGFVAGDAVCDGEVDCADGSDEVPCSTDGVGGSSGSAGSGGASATDGSAGLAGAGGSGGTGAAGSGGTGAAGSGGIDTTGNPESCTFDIRSELSPMISTVGIVEWDVDLESVDSAVIEFGVTGDGSELDAVAPVDLSQENYRTLLLGLKSATEYAFRIVASSGGSTCASQTVTLQTGYLPGRVPSVSTQVLNASAIAPGFFITSSVQGGSESEILIFDQDGDIVWWWSGPAWTSRARMSWDGRSMWMLAANVAGTGGEVRRVSMDGLEVEPNVSGLDQAHHDFSVMPDGSVVAIAYGAEGEAGCSSIIARSTDGQVTTLVEDVSALYPASADCHPDAIQYHPEREQFTIAVHGEDLFVNFERAGAPLWQFGGPSFAAPHLPGTWTGNHGHQLLENGNLLFFSNGDGAQSLALEYQLGLESLVATEVWRYSGGHGSQTLGDVQRLPNGNTLVAYSNEGVIHEVDPAGSLIQTFSIGNSLGYVTHRPTLYGPPPR